MELEEVELLPNALVTCFINNEELRILKLSPRSITLRMLKEVNEIFSFRLEFYNFDSDTYEEVEITKFQINNFLKSEFYTEGKFYIDDDEYRNLVRKITKDYLNYIRLKSEGIDNEFSMEMVGYKAEKDYDFYESYIKQKKSLLKNIKNLDFLCDKFSLAVKLDNYTLYNEYLKRDIESFSKWYFEKNYLEEHFLSKKNISRLYIGNEFCHNLFPNLELLKKLLMKACKEKLDITLAFTYLREELIEKTKTIIEEVYLFCKENEIKIEVVVNDWGIIKLFDMKNEYFDFNLGILLNKRKKDPRMVYKNVSDNKRELFEINNLNSQFFIDYLGSLNINRFEFESVGYKIKLPIGSHSLQLPFYQTNTSQYCTLYASCNNYYRGKQSLVNNCPLYCNRYAFLYPKHLSLFGIYNSLFGFDKNILIDNDLFNYYINNGIDRIVLNFM